MDYFWASIQKREQAFSRRFDGHSRDRVSTTAQMLEGAAVGPLRAIPPDPPGLAARRLNPGVGRRRTRGAGESLPGGGELAGDFCGGTGAPERPNRAARRRRGDPLERRGVD